MRTYFKEQYNQDLPTDFRSMDLSQTKMMFEYCLDKYNKITANNPLAFRTGALRFNGNSVRIAKDYNIKLMSDYMAIKPYGCYSPNHDHHTIVPGLHDPYVWDNGIFEMPVHVNMLFYSRSKEQLLENIRQAFQNSDTGLITLLLHSWSFLFRDGTEEFKYVGNKYPLVLSEILDDLAKEVTFVSTQDILDLYDKQIIQPYHVIETNMFE
jgi:hypothetical protein